MNPGRNQLGVDPGGCLEANPALHFLARRASLADFPGNPDVRWLQERTFQRGD